MDAVLQNVINELCLELDKEDINYDLVNNQITRIDMLMDMTCNS